MQALDQGRPTLAEGMMAPAQEVSAFQNLDTSLLRTETLGLKENLSDKAASTKLKRKVSFFHAWRML